MAQFVRAGVAGQARGWMVAVLCFSGSRGHSADVVGAMQQLLRTGNADPGHSLMLNLSEFERALNGEDWPQRVLADPMLWGMAAAAVGAAILAAVVIVRRRRDLAVHGPTWRRLAQRLRLSSEQRHLLRTLARHVGQTNPAALVISRGCFDRAVQRSYPRPRKVPVTVRALRRELFEES